MRVIKLNPEDLSETGDSYGDYDSLAWNEKYQEYGDFQLRSYDVEGALEFFTTDTFVGIPNSHTAMRVDRVELELSESGTQMVTVSGKGVESIFEFRPALWSIVGTGDSFRTDHMFGDDRETNPEYFLDPATIASEIYERVNEQSYGYPKRFGHLRLPFHNDIVSLLPEDPDFTSEKIPSYTFGGGSVWEAFSDLMEIGQFHLTVIRPGGFPGWPEGPRLMGYKPKRAMSQDDSLGKDSYPMTLSAVRNDYLAGKQGESSEAPNIRFRSHEDGVMETWVGEAKPKGLHARVGYDEVSIGKMTEYNFRLEETTKFLMPFAQTLLDRETFSLTTDGVFPMDPKTYGIPVSEVLTPNFYYLGDVLTIEFPWGDTVDVRVVEFIRTYDSGGAKEYPSFKPVLYSNQDLSRVIGDPEPIQYINDRIRKNIIAELEKGVYSKDLIDAFRNYVMHRDWL